MAMDKSAADAYVYAKASGMLARSFIGGRAAQLFEVHSLKELWTLLFKKEVPVMSENADLSGKALPFVGLAEGICLWGFLVALLIIIL